MKHKQTLSRQKIVPWNYFFRHLCVKVQFVLHYRITNNSRPILSYHGHEIISICLPRQRSEKQSLFDQYIKRAWL